LAFQFDDFLPVIILTLNTQALRAYTNDDVIGVEVGGSVKNILAIAAGIAAGIGIKTFSCPSNRLFFCE
jgi:glycerol-3-phosphate dehydrogenase